MIYNLTEVLGRPHFSIVFGNDIIMTSFLITWFSNLYILWNLVKAISLQSFSALDFLGQVLQRNYKNNDDVIVTSFHEFGDWKFSYYVKLVTSYQPAKFQIPQLSESNFTEVFIRHPKKPL